MFFAEKYYFNVTEKRTISHVNVLPTKGFIKPKRRTIPKFYICKCVILFK